MSATPKKTPAVDLSKAKIGQRLKLRNGEIALFQGDSGGSSYPFLYEANTGAQVGEARTATQYGFYSVSEPNHELDIIAILPLPKKKAAKKLKTIPEPTPPKLHRVVIHLQVTKTNTAAIKRLLAGLQKTLGPVEGPHAVIKYETCQIRQLMTTAPPNPS